MRLAGRGMVGWILVRAVLRRHELRPSVVDDRGVQIGQGTIAGEPPEVGVVLRADAGAPVRAHRAGPRRVMPADPVVRIVFGTLFRLFASNFLHAWTFTLFSEVAVAPFSNALPAAPGGVSVERQVTRWWRWW